MPEYKPMHKYPEKTRIQTKTGYIIVKGKDGWKTEHRLVAEAVEGRALGPNEKVFHKNGIRDDNRERNLAVIKFNTTKYSLLASRLILYIPRYVEMEK